MTGGDRGFEGHRLDRLQAYLGAEARRHPHPPTPQTARTAQPGRTVQPGRPTGSTTRAASTPRPAGRNIPRIVVGIDGSRSSLAALRWAADEARKRGARLQAVTAYRHDPALRPPGETYAAHSARDTLQRVLREAGIGNADVDAVTVASPPAPGLVETARHAEMLVVGTRGDPGTRGHRRAEAPLGSVSMYCVGHAGCPVVVVPAKQ